MRTQRLLGDKNFDLIKQDQLQVIDHGITTRHVDAAEATRCSRAHNLSLCSRCNTFEVSHTCGEEVLRLCTTRSARSKRRERGRAAAD